MHAHDPYTVPFLSFIYLFMYQPHTYIRSHTMLRTSKEARQPAAYPTDRSPSI